MSLRHLAQISSDSRNDLVQYFAMCGVWALSTYSACDIGCRYCVTYAQGPSTIEDESSLDKRLVGIDATFRYRPLRRAIYRRLNLRTELIWSRQDLPLDLHASGFGFYGVGEYQFAQRWYIGARGDRSSRIYDGDLVDTGGSVFLTFWPTEFSQIRGQYRRINYAEGINGNEFLFQFNFAIGAHGAHAF